jgi:hypothetical protein
MAANVVFDQSVYVKEAIQTVLHEGMLGLILTSLMILIFLGEFPGNFGCPALSSIVSAGYVRRAVHDGKHRQHDGSRRVGVGILPRD